jgi:hypothetical protein
MRITEYAPPSDTVAPTVPANVQITDITHDSFAVDWDSSSDNTGVVGYRVYLNNMQLASTPDTSYQFSGLEQSTSYIVSVTAFDSASNESAKSLPIMVATLDTVAPVLEVTDTVYAEGNIEVTSSEDAILYMVHGGTIKEIGAIQEAAIDSITALAGLAVQIPVEGLDNGSYWIYARDSAGNISEPGVTIIMGVGISEYTPNQFRVYPIPMTQTATLHFSIVEQQQMWLLVLDYNGRLVNRENIGSLTSGDHQVVFRRNGLPEGLYFLRLVSTDGLWGTTKVIIQD